MCDLTWPEYYKLSRLCEAIVEQGKKSAEIRFFLLVSEMFLSGNTALEPGKKIIESC